MHSCPRCKAANPSEAAYCHFDGAELRPVNGSGPTIKPLPQDFVFPSGRRCKTFDELVVGCYDEWDQARDLHRRGVFHQFLTNSGRLDLARVALESQTHHDLDVALDTFVASLPAIVQKRPRLDLAPRRFDLGALSVGEKREVELTILNQGKGLLLGSVAVADASGWIKIGDGLGTGEFEIKTTTEQKVRLKIDTQGLAAPHRYSSKLTVITNGGIVEVPVRIDLAVQAFARPPFQGAVTPREMAEKMRGSPKAAVPLLESGEICRWFERNGWNYPVVGPPAKGVAAVQQFFEGMGLSKPPAVRLLEDDLRLMCERRSAIHGQLTLRTEAKKWVYARAECEAPWLKLSTADASGPQQAVLEFEADAKDLAPNQTHSTIVKIVTNADQHLEAKVFLVIRKPPQSGQRRLLRPFMIGALACLLFRMFVAIPADAYARLYLGWNRPQFASYSGWLESPSADPLFARHFVIALGWMGAVICAALLWKRRGTLGDVICGLIGGAAAGLACSATLAFLWPVLDFLPRFAWREIGILLGLTTKTAPPLLWCGIWIVIAASSWAVLGGVMGLALNLAGRQGSTCVDAIGRVLSTMLRGIGFKRAALYFVIE